MPSRSSFVQAARLLAAAALLSVLVSGRAEAACEITGATSSSPSSISLGTYSGTSFPAATSTTLNLSIQVTGNGSGSCQGGVVLRRATSPASLAASGTTVTLPYAATLGGAAMTFSSTAAANPSTIGTTSTISAPGSPTTITVTATLSLTPSSATATPGSSSNFSDTLFIDVYDVQGSKKSHVGTITLTLTAIIRQACTISSPANISQVMLTSLGRTTGMQGGAATINVTCGSAANVSLTSQKGAVTLDGVSRSSLAALSGFRNAIDYTASINGGAGAVTLNTSSATTVTGVFNSAAVSTTGTQVTITPVSSSLPLVAGSYNDVLTIAVTPQ